MKSNFGSENEEQRNVGQSQSYPTNDYLFPILPIVYQKQDENSRVELQLNTDCKKDIGQPAESRRTVEDQMAKNAQPTAIRLN